MPENQGGSENLKVYKLNLQSLRKSKNYFPRETFIYKTIQFSSSFVLLRSYRLNLQNIKKSKKYFTFLEKILFTKHFKLSYFQVTFIGKN